MLDQPLSNAEWTLAERQRKEAAARAMEASFVQLKDVVMKVKIKSTTSLAVAKLRTEYEEWVRDNEVHVVWRC